MHGQCVHVRVALERPQQVGKPVPDHQGYHDLSNRKSVLLVIVLSALMKKIKMERPVWLERGAHTYRAAEKQNGQGDEHERGLEPPEPMEHAQEDDLHGHGDGEQRQHDDFVVRMRGC